MNLNVSAIVSGVANGQPSSSVICPRVLLNIPYISLAPPLSIVDWIQGLVVQGPTV